MARTKKTTKPNTKRTPGSSKSGGFLFGLTLPPLAVIIVGIVIACVLSQVTAETTVSSSYYLGNSQLAPFFTPEVRYWENKILAWSQDYDLDPNLVATVMQIESCGNPKAKSSAGAMGLFQVMPFHFRVDENPFNPNTNATRGLQHLKNSIDANNGNIRNGLAGYYAVISRSRNPEHNWPNETKRYVYFGEQIYLDTKAGKTKSERLDEWFYTLGRSMCNQAANSLGID